MLFSACKQKDTNEKLPPAQTALRLMYKGKPVDIVAHRQAIDAASPETSREMERETEWVLVS